MAFLAGIFNKEIQGCERNCKIDLVGYPKEVIKACKKACRNEDPPPVDGWQFLERYPPSQRYWNAEGMILTGLGSDQEDSQTTFVIGLVFLALVAFLLKRLLVK